MEDEQTNNQEETTLVALTILVANVLVVVVKVKLQSVMMVDEKDTW